VSDCFLSSPPHFKTPSRAVSPLFFEFLERMFLYVLAFPPPFFGKEKNKCFGVHISSQDLPSQFGLARFPGTPLEFPSPRAPAHRAVRFPFLPQLPFPPFGSSVIPPSGIPFPGTFCFLLSSESFLLGAGRFPPLRPSLFN